jgi:hypothetical protein
MRFPQKNGWYVAVAKMKDGSEVDLLRHGAAVDWNKLPFPARLCKQISRFALRRVELPTAELRR